MHPPVTEKRAHWLALSVSCLILIVVILVLLAENEIKQAKPGISHPSLNHKQGLNKTLATARIVDRIEFETLIGKRGQDVISMMGSPAHIVTKPNEMLWIYHSVWGYPIAVVHYELGDVVRMSYPEIK